MSDTPLTDELDALYAKATPGPWTVWDSCSFRRISHKGDGDVISGTIQHSDGQVDLRAKRSDLDFLCALVNAWPQISARLAESEKARGEAEALAERSTRRMVEMAEPGFIGAFAARDAANARAESLAAQVETLTQALRDIRATAEGNAESLRKCGGEIGAIVAEHYDAFVARIAALDVQREGA